MTSAVLHDAEECNKNKNRVLSRFLAIIPYKEKLLSNTLSIITSPPQHQTTLSRYVDIATINVNMYIKSDLGQFIIIIMSFF